MEFTHLCCMTDKYSPCGESGYGRTEINKEEINGLTVLMPNERLRGGNDTKDLVTLECGDAPKKVEKKPVNPKCGPEKNSSDANKSLNQGTEQVDAVKTLFKKIQEDRNVQQQISQVIGQVVPLLFGDQLQGLLNPQPSPKPHWYQEFATRLFNSRETPVPPSFRTPPIPPPQAKPNFQIPIQHLQRLQTQLQIPQSQFQMPQRPLQSPQHLQRLAQCQFQMPQYQQQRHLVSPLHLSTPSPQLLHPMQQWDLQRMHENQFQLNLPYVAEQPLPLSSPPIFAQQYPLNSYRPAQSMYSAPEIKLLSQPASTTNCSYKRTFVVTSRDSDLSKSKPGKAVVTFKRRTNCPQQYLPQETHVALDTVDMCHSGHNGSIQYQPLTMPAGVRERQMRMPISPQNVHRVYLRSSAKPSTAALQGYQLPTHQQLKVAQRPRELFSAPRIVTRPELSSPRNDKFVRFVEGPQNLPSSSLHNRVTFQGSGEQCYDWPITYSDVHHAHSIQSIQAANDINVSPLTAYYSGLRLGGGGGGHTILKCRRLAGSGCGSSDVIPEFQNTYSRQKVFVGYTPEYPKFVKDSFEPSEQKKRRAETFPASPEMILKRITENISRESLQPIPPPTGFLDNVSLYASEQDLGSESDQSNKSVESERASQSALRGNIHRLIENGPHNNPVVFNKSVRSIPVNKPNNQPKYQQMSQVSNRSVPHTIPHNTQRHVTDQIQSNQASIEDTHYKEKTWNRNLESSPTEFLPQSQNRQHNSSQYGTHSGKKSHFYHPQNIQTPREQRINDYVEHPAERSRRVRFAKDLGTNSAQQSLTANLTPEHEIQHPTLANQVLLRSNESNRRSDNRMETKRNIKTQRSQVPASTTHSQPMSNYHRPTNSGNENHVNVSTSSNEKAAAASAVAIKPVSSNMLSKKSAILDNYYHQQSTNPEKRPASRSNKDQNMYAQESIQMQHKNQKPENMMQNTERGVQEPTQVVTEIPRTSSSIKSQQLRKQGKGEQVNRAFNIVDFNPQTHQLATQQNYVAYEFSNPYDQAIVERYGGYFTPKKSRPSNQRLGLIFDSPLQRSIIYASTHKNASLLHSNTDQLPLDFGNTDDWVSKVEDHVTTVDSSEEHSSVESEDSNTSTKSTESADRQIGSGITESERTNNIRIEESSERMLEDLIPRQPNDDYDREIYDTEDVNEQEYDNYISSDNIVNVEQDTNQHEQTSNLSRIENTELIDNTEYLDDHSRCNRTDKQLIQGGKKRNSRQQQQFQVEQEGQSFKTHQERQRGVRDESHRHFAHQNKLQMQTKRNHEDFEEQVYIPETRYNTTTQDNRRIHVRERGKHDNIIPEETENRIKNNFQERHYISNEGDAEEIVDGGDHDLCMKQTKTKKLNQEGIDNRRKFSNQERRSAQDEGVVEDTPDIDQTSATNTKVYKRQHSHQVIANIPRKYNDEDGSNHQDRRNNENISERARGSRRSTKQEEDDYVEQQGENSARPFMSQQSELNQRPEEDERNDSNPDLDLPQWTTAYLMRGSMSNTDERVSTAKGNKRGSKWAADLHVRANASVESDPFSDVSSVDTIEYLKAKTLDEEGLPRYSDIEEYFNHSGTESEFEETPTDHKAQNHTAKETTLKNLKDKLKEEMPIRKRGNVQAPKSERKLMMKQEEQKRTYDERRSHEKAGRQKNGKLAFSVAEIYGTPSWRKEVPKKKANFVVKGH